MFLNLFRESLCKKMEDGSWELKVFRQSKFFFNKKSVAFIFN